MELTCDKDKTRMASETAFCAHPEEYCKFRGACIINFITTERMRRERAEGEVELDHGGSDEERQA